MWDDYVMTMDGVVVPLVQSPLLMIRRIVLLRRWRRLRPLTSPPLPVGLRRGRDELLIMVVMVLVVVV